MQIRPCDLGKVVGFTSLALLQWDKGPRVAISVVGAGTDVQRQPLALDRGRKDLIIFGMMDQEIQQLTP